MRSAPYLSLCLGLLAAGCSAWIDTDETKIGLSPGAPSCATGCDDGIACTQDSCSAGRCVNQPVAAMCQAGERCDVAQGCVDQGVCSGAGCNDAGSNPACQGNDIDMDNDGHLARIAALPQCGDDCDDRNPAIHGGASEQCDGQDNNCDGMVDEGCSSSDACQEARTITLTNGRAQLTGMLRSTGTRFDASCGAPAGRGAVFKLDVTQLADIIIDTSGSDVPMMVAVGTTCAAKGGFNLACANAARQGTQSARMVIHRYDPSKQAGSLYLLVDTTAERGGSKFALDVRVQPAVSYSCAPGMPLEMSTAGTLVGFMAGSGSLTGSCNAASVGFPPVNPPEVVLRYTPTGAASVRCEVSSPSFAPALYVGPSCGGLLGNFLDSDCDQAGGSSGTAALDLQLTQPVFLVIDNGKEGGKYEITCTPR